MKRAILVLALAVLGCGGDGSEGWPAGSQVPESEQFCEENLNGGLCPYAQYRKPEPRCASGSAWYQETEGYSIGLALCCHSTHGVCE